MADKSPAFQFYPADYLADEKVQFLTSAQEGIYIRLLSYCWREGSIPADPELAMMSCKRDAKKKDVEHVLRSFFAQSPTPGRLVNPRLEKERRKQAERSVKASEAGRISATKRQRSLNGNSTNVERTLDSSCGLVPTEFNPSSSSSSSGINKYTGGDDLTFLVGGRSPAFNRFIAAYPRPASPEFAWETWQAKVYQLSARHGKSDAEIEEMLIKAAEEYRDSPAGQPPESGDDFRLGAAKWLLGNCFEEPRELWQQTKRKPVKPKSSAKKDTSAVEEFFAQQGLGNATG